jgi:para-aminobenzoate synthetase/4-amino-4-deoxychorismate lyase
MDPARPFLLAIDAASGGARLFADPTAILEAGPAGEVPALLAEMQAALAGGHWVAGGLGYGAGAVLAGGPARQGGGPAGWFGRFGPPRWLSAAALGQWLDRHGRPAVWGAVRPRIARADYLAAVAQAQQWIADGDIYQLNFTFPAEVEASGHPIALFARTFRAAAAPHAALAHLGGGRWWLSFSPERLFMLDGGRLSTRPMKGTAARRPTAAADRAAAQALARDRKNRAENLMITDLLRNDCARVADPGSVVVEQLFAIETYPSVHQMTSTVTARLRPGLDVADVLAALFPSGSVTGAPKIRAMERIAALEGSPRGIYCGSIGWAAPSGAAAFNVAIRTVAIAPAGRGRLATLGLGSGIVADSSPEAEWAECLVKARFLAQRPECSLLETMRREGDGSIALLSRHLDRMEGSAGWLGFVWDRAAVEARIRALPPAGRRQRLRLLAARSGRVAIQLSPLAPSPGAIMAGLAPRPVAADDWRLFHKTSDRAFLDAPRVASAVPELLFHDGDLMCEGSFTTIFLDRGDGIFVTPPLARGVLPGVLRAELLAHGRAVEGDITIAGACAAAAAGRLWLGNALRGLMRATLARPGNRS